MVVAMRLMRMGTTHNPVYRISVGDSRKAPTAKFIEHIGTYNPRPDKMGHKQLRLNVARAKYWIAMGCQPSSMVARLLSRFHLLPVPPARINVTSGSMLHRALAGEDLRPELRTLAGLKPFENEGEENEVEEKEDEEDGVNYLEAMLRRHPSKDRRMKELTPERIVQVQRQSRWMLQAFPFDPSPSLATLAAWDQARRFHRVIPQREPADAVGTFRDQLQEAEERRVRMQHAAEDAENGRQRTLAMLAEDAADQVAEIDWVRARGLPTEQYDEIVRTYMQREREMAQKQVAEQATEAAARRARIAQRAAAIAADKAAGRERDAAALEQDAADDEAESAYRLLTASATGGRTPSLGEREQIVQDYMQAKRDTAEARLLTLDSAELHELDDPDMMEADVTEEVGRQIEAEDNGEDVDVDEDQAIAEIDESEDAPVADPEAEVISDLDGLKLSAEDLAEVEADEEDVVALEDEIEGEPKKAAIEAGEAKEGEVAEAKEGEEAAPAAAAAESAESDQKAPEVVEEMDEETAALVAEEAALAADPDFAVAEAQIQALGLHPLTEADDDADRAAVFAEDREAELDLKNSPEESLDALNDVVVEEMIIQHTQPGLEEDAEEAKEAADKAEAAAEAAAKQKEREMNFDQLTPRQREQLLMQKLHDDEEAARVLYVAAQREALKRNQAKSRQEVRGPLVLEPVDMAAIRFDEHLQRARAEGEQAGAAAQAQQRDLDSEMEADEHDDLETDADLELELEAEEDEEVDLEELHANEAPIDAAEDVEVEVEEAVEAEEEEEPIDEAAEDERPELEELEEEEESARRGRKDE